MLTSVTSNQTSGFQSLTQSITNEKDQSLASLNQGKQASLPSNSSKPTNKALAQLTREEKNQVQKLKNRDLEVKAHEQAHLSAAGNLSISGATYNYTTGPNGVAYVTGGDVKIDASPVLNDPAATIKKAKIIHRAALAPVNPSKQDQLVANQALTLEQKSRVELSQANNKQQEQINQQEQAKEAEPSKQDNYQAAQPFSTESNSSRPGSLFNISA